MRVLCRATLFILFFSPFLSGEEPVQATPPERSYAEILFGYMSAEDAWTVYRKNSIAMQQDLKFSRDRFYKQGIKRCDELAQSARRLHSDYEQYANAYRVLSLTPISRLEFIGLSPSQRQEKLTDGLDTSEKWPTYTTNMKRMGLNRLSAQEFLNCSTEERQKLFNLSVGKQRSFLQAVRGFYSATEGWDTYSKYRKAMELELEYSEKEFINLQISKIDELARTSKRISEDYETYDDAMGILKLKPIGRVSFAKLGDEKRVILVESAVDSANKFPVYRESMQKMDQTFLSALNFHELSAEQRLQHFSKSQGTSRSTMQAATNYYSCAAGWNTYIQSMDAMGLNPEYNRYEFINFSIEKIDRLARHARHSLYCYKGLRALYINASKTFPYTAKEVYSSADLSRWENILDQRLEEWAPRITYNKSCKELDEVANWKHFDSCTQPEQLNLAAATHRRAKAMSWQRKKDALKEAKNDAIGFLGDNKEAIAEFVVKAAAMYLQSEYGGAEDKVRVRGYQRNDGTYVRPHYRSAPK